MSEKEKAVIYMTNGGGHPPKDQEQVSPKGKPEEQEGTTAEQK